MGLTVKCMIFTDTLKRLPLHGVSVEEWCEGLPITPVELSNSKHEVDWDLMLDLLGRLHELLGGDDGILELTLDTMKHSHSGEINRFYRLAASPQQLYRAFAWSQHYFSYGITSSLEVLEDSRLRITSRVTLDARAAEVLWTTTYAMLVGLPLFLDLQPALVEKVPSDDLRERVFLVQAPESASLVARLKRSWTMLQGERSGFDYLVEQQRRLLEQYQLLEAANQENLETLEQLQIEAERRVAAEERLQQSQRLEAIGQLAGGVAHDFNNLLTAIIGNIDLMMYKLPEDSPLRTSAEEALQAAESGAELTQSLLAFSRKQPLLSQVLDVNNVVEDTAQLLRRTLPESIELLVIPSEEPQLTKVDAGQLQNAILNLGINSQHALPKGGIIGIEVGVGCPEFSPEDYVSVTVTDNGIGMDPEILEHVFEPFFSTRDSGVGSGMGLSMVHGFIHQSGGDIVIESRLGEGTRVCLCFPRSEGTPVELIRTSSSYPRGAGERILIVEDHPQVRRVAEWLLSRLGYRTVVAVDGAQALELIDEEVDLLFTDIIMPGEISGIELARRACEMHPDLPILFTSGYAPEHTGADSVPLLTKPYTTESLAHAIRKQLDTDSKA